MAARSAVEKMAARYVWGEPILPYQFEPESEVESEPEQDKEGAAEHLHEGKNVKCEDESPNEIEWELDSPVQSSAFEKKNAPDAARQNPKSVNEWTTKLVTDIQEDEEFSTSLSVGDGRYLVDLGSSSEFIVDEECLLELFRSCRRCSGECKVRKRVEGLRLVLTQACFFCENRFTWTNLSDDDDDKDDSDF